MNELSMEDIERRSLEIEEELKGGSADVDALEQEVAELEERKAEIVRQTEERKKEIEAVERTAKEFKSFESNEGGKTMNLNEVRSTKEYTNAYVNWLKTGRDHEIRRVLTELASPEVIGETDTTFPVPSIVDSYVRTAWENDEIMKAVRKTFFKAQLKIPFEISGTPAWIHNEGDEAVSEEDLQIGYAKLDPVTFKKWIRVTSELYELGGEEFLKYIYDEIAYKIVFTEADEVIGDIIASPSVSSRTAPGVKVLTEATMSASTIARAEGLLSGEARNLVAIMNPSTRADLKAIAIGSGTNVGDPFDGLRVILTDSLPSYATASTGDTYIIVGDLEGVQANFPNGDDIKFIFDEKSEAEADLVKIVGRVYGAVGVVAPYRFAKVNK